MDTEMDTKSMSRLGSRRVVATYLRYTDAQRAVDYLADHKFPVQHVAIVAEGLRIVEQVTGRLTYGRVALNGALSGAVIGGFFGFLFGLFDWIRPVLSAFQLALYGLLYGAFIGALMNMVFYAMTGGKRDFASVGGIDADRYNLIVDEEVADEAVRLLAQGRKLPGRGSEPTGTGPMPQPA